MLNIDSLETGIVIDHIQPVLFNFLTAYGCHSVTPEEAPGAKSFLLGTTKIRKVRQIARICPRVGEFRRICESPIATATHLLLQRVSMAIRRGFYVHNQP